MMDKWTYTTSVLTTKSRCSMPKLVAVDIPNKLKIIHYSRRRSVKQTDLEYGKFGILKPYLPLITSLSTIITGMHGQPNKDAVRIFQEDSLSGCLL